MYAVSYPSHSLLLHHLFFICFLSEIMSFVMVTSVVRDDDGVREENIPWEQSLLIVAIPDGSDCIFWNLHTLTFGKGSSMFLWFSLGSAVFLLIS